MAEERMEKNVDVELENPADFTSPGRREADTGGH